MRIMYFALKIITLLLSESAFAGPLISSSLSYNAYASPRGTDCVKHPLQCAIMSLQPALAAGEARLLSNLIHKYSNKYNVDPYRVIAIGMQESSLRNINRYETFFTEQGEVRRVETDIGLFQFNIGTIDAYGIDINRLRIDVAYQVERMCYLLARKLVYCSDLGKDAWVCYHSRTLLLRDKYKEMVNKYYLNTQKGD